MIFTQHLSIPLLFRKTFPLLTLLALLLGVSCSQTESTGPEEENSSSGEGEDTLLSSNQGWSNTSNSSDAHWSSTLGNSSAQLSSSTLQSSSSLNTSITDLLTKEQFNQIFPIMDPSDPYYTDRRTACAEQAHCREVTTYEGLIEAAGKFEDFLAVGSLEDRKRELAAFFANVGKETTGGWDTAPGGYESWGLCFCEEVGGQGYTESNDPNYQAVTGKSYHGRGALQISYPYNYGPASEYIFGDKNVLLNNPEKVTETALAFWGGSIWFWTVKEDVAPGETPPQGEPATKGFDGKYYKPSCHMAMTGSWHPRSSDIEKNRTHGLGVTINVINGGLECAWGWDDRGKGRVKNYNAFATILGVDPIPANWSGSADDYLGCQNQTSFATP